MLAFKTRLLKEKMSMCLCICIAQKTAIKNSESKSLRKDFIKQLREYCIPVYNGCLCMENFQER